MDTSGFCVPIRLSLSRFGTRWGSGAGQRTNSRRRDTSQFPHALYIREARRLVGTVVMSQHDVATGDMLTKSESVGLGSYGYDSHYAQRCRAAAKAAAILRSKKKVVFPTSDATCSKCLVKLSYQSRPSATTSSFQGVNLCVAHSQHARCCLHNS